MSTWKRIAVGIVVSVAVATGAWAQKDQTEKEQQTKAVELSSFECKDVMRTTGADRDIALGFLHGYFFAKKGKTAYDSAKMAAATDQFIEYCLDNPKAKAVEAMSKFAE